MRVLFLTKYKFKGASSRYRTLQYLPFLKEKKIDCIVSPLFNDEYLDYKYKYGKVDKLLTLKLIISRIKTVLLNVYSYDLIVIEKEILPYFPPFFEIYLKLIGKPYIVDYDDAIWHNYDNHKYRVVRWLLGKKIGTVMKLARLVIAGSDYIANYAKKYNANVVKIPTVIDTTKYVCKKENVKKEEFVIGWIGSPSSSKNLLLVNEPLRIFTKKYNAIVHLIGFDRNLKGKLRFRYKLIDWNSNTEIEEICKFDVGIMPLVDGPFERGKCGFKLIQYMGCKKPVIASPVGENKVIVKHGINGFLATNQNEWFNFLKILFGNKQLREKMGLSGYRRVRNFYSLQVTVDKYVSLLMRIKEECR